MGIMDVEPISTVSIIGANNYFRQPPKIPWHTAITP